LLHKQKQSYCAISWERYYNDNRPQRSRPLYRALEIYPSFMT